MSAIVMPLPTKKSELPLHYSYLSITSNNPRQFVVAFYLTSFSEQSGFEWIMKENASAASITLSI